MKKTEAVKKASFFIAMLLANIKGCKNYHEDDSQDFVILLQAGASAEHASTVTACNQRIKQLVTRART